MKKQYLTVTALTRYLKRKIDMDQHLKNVWIQAEISNFKLHSRGHMYFTLKDENSRISAVMFATQNQRLKFMPENGMKVLIQGDVSIYEPMGQYQIYVQNMEPDGLGALHLAYEQLKEKLEKQGLFDSSRKKPIPKYPKRIAIITSPTGAAVRDIITTLKRRFPMVRRTIIPVSVQGPQAAPTIVNAIEKANHLGGFDTIIVGRGGGSIEELWAFNEEIVALAISNSKIPVISAVGHETDYTISDFIADLRAPTPTAAAELAVPSIIDLHQQSKGQSHRLYQQVHHMIFSSRNQLRRMQQAYAFKYPIHLIRQKEQDLDRLVININRHSKRFLLEKQKDYNNVDMRLNRNNPKKVISDYHKELQYQHQQLNQAVSKEFEKQYIRYEKQLDKLTLLNPLETMKRGYSIAYKGDQIVKSTEQVSPGDAIKISLSNGLLDCQVWGIEEKEE